MTDHRYPRLEEGVVERGQIPTEKNTKQKAIERQILGFVFRVLQIVPA